VTLLDFVQKPVVLGHHDMEEMATDYIKYLASHKGMSYRTAWNILNSHKEMIEEAIKTLNWNAGMEMADKQVTFVINKG
jgi:uncharacterized protein YdhG (YjbR/CyaY superfamily)